MRRNHEPVPLFGFAIGVADELGDHMHQVFVREDDIGTDDSIARQVADVDPTKLICACGLAAADMTEFDDHLSLVTPDGIGAYGGQHVRFDPQPPIDGSCLRIPGEPEEQETAH